MHPRSGAGRIKADASTDHEVIEVKDANKSYTLHGRDLLTVFRVATRSGKSPRFVVYFQDADMTADITISKGRP